MSTADRIVQQSTVSKVSMAQAVSVLEQCFREIYRSRMSDVPIVNTKLSVATGGFRPWGEHWLGALLTPWFLNLVMLPKELETEAVSVGSKCKHTLPCGDFTFIASHEPGLGDFWSCSLMSPVLELVDQQQAEAVMREVLTVIFESPTDEEWVLEKSDIERFQLNHKQQQLQKIKQQESTSDIAQDTPQEVCNRREFFSRCMGKPQKKC